MALPDQVQRAVDRANELFDQVNAPTPEPAPVSQEPAPEPQAEPPVDNVPAPADPAPAPQEDWEHKYRTLQGVFTAHKRDSEARFTALEARLNAAPAAPAPAPAPAAPTSRVTKEEVDTYGAELMDVIGRKAQEIADAQIAAMRAELQPQLEQTRARVQEVSQQVYTNDRERFYGELAKAVPDWETVNNDQRFFAWLDEIDPLSNVARRVYLDKAGADLNHVQAATLFSAFKTSVGMNTPPASAPPAPAAAPAAPASRLSPSPRTANAASAPSHNAPDMSVSRTQIAAHYSRGARDTGYARSQEHVDMEKKIQAALANNQVTEA